MMGRNVFIVNFNTQNLTDACIRSVNKFSPGCRVFVLDNSDREPFKNLFSNVTVFNNTAGEIIDFDRWLDGYPKRKRSPGRRNGWGSAKHAYSVERGMELIGEPFLLLDSDVLLKKDVTPLFDEGFSYIGEVVEQDSRTKIKRVLPYVCFINTPMCLENGVHYFDETHMHGLCVGPKGDNYDTGAALFLGVEGKGLPHNEIRWSDYAEHYGSGSWLQESVNMRKKEKISLETWLSKFEHLWNDGNETAMDDNNAPGEGEMVRPEEKPERKKAVSPKSIISLRNNGSSTRKIYLTKV